MDLHLYEKYSKKYHKKARLGITLKTYLLSIRTFSIYTKLMGKDAFFCPKNTKSEVKNNVSKTSKKVSEIKEEKQKIRSFRSLKLNSVDRKSVV